MSYRQILLKNKTLAILSLVQFLSYFAARFSSVGIFTMLISFNASAFSISLMTAMYFLPAIFIAPFGGSLSDLIPYKKLMLYSLFIEAIMTIGFLGISNIDQIWILGILLFIRMGSASIFFITNMNVISQIVDDKLLIKANEIHSIIWSVTFVLGVAFGGIIVDELGVWASFVIDAGLFFIAMFVLTKIQFNINQTEIKTKLYKTIKDGISYIKQNKLIIHLIIIHSVVGVSVFDALVTLLADKNYKYIIAVPLAIGLTNGVRGIGLMIGPMLLSNYINKKSIFYLFIIQGLFIILWAFIQFDFYYSLVGMFLTGLFTTTLWSYTYTLLQKNTKESFRGRVFAYNEMTFMLSAIFTTMFIGIAYSYISLFLISVILGVIFIISAFYFKYIINSYKVL
jgi:MFS family permease